MTTPTDTESVERLAGKLSDLATREATTMPPGWPDAHGTYSDGADTLRALAEERDRLREALEAVRVHTDTTGIRNLRPAHLKRMIALADRAARAALKQENKQDD